LRRLFIYKLLQLPAFKTFAYCDDSFSVTACSRPPSFYLIIKPSSGNRSGATRPKSKVISRAVAARRDQRRAAAGYDAAATTASIEYVLMEGLAANGLRSSKKPMASCSFRPRNTKKKKRGLGRGVPKRRLQLAPDLTAPVGTPRLLRPQIFRLVSQHP